MGALDTFSTSVDSRFATVDASLETLAGQVATLSGSVEELQADVGAVKSLLTQYYKVSLSTTRVSYATGEEASIVAEVRDLQGQPIAFADADRPWIDFVAVWGHLRAAEGFQSESGDSSGGERAVSVRTNGAGVAKALLRAEVGQDLALEAHADVAATLTAKLPNKLSIAETIMQAPTPVDAKNAGAFASVAVEYDRPAATGVRSFLDTYYVHRAPSVIGKVSPPIFTAALARLRVDRRRGRSCGRRPDDAGSGPRVRFDPRCVPRLDRAVAAAPLPRPRAARAGGHRLPRQAPAAFHGRLLRLRDAFEDGGGDARRATTAASSGGSATSRPCTGRWTGSPCPARRPRREGVADGAAGRRAAAGVRARPGRDVRRDRAGSSPSTRSPARRSRPPPMSARSRRKWRRSSRRSTTVSTKIDSAHTSLATLDGRVTEASSSLTTISNSVSNVGEPGEQGPAALSGGRQGSVPVAQGGGARRAEHQEALEPDVRLRR